MSAWGETDSIEKDRWPEARVSVLVRSPVLISHKWRNLVASARSFGVLLWAAVADVVLSFSGVGFVLFCFVFAFSVLLMSRSFVQSFFDMHAPGQPRTVS